MSFMKLLLIGVIGIALLNLSADRRGEAALAISNVAGAGKLGERVRARVGIIGAHVMSPVVRATLDETRTAVDDLAPAISRARPHEIQRARVFTRKIEALDSAAIHSLETGHPVLAMKQALSGKQFLSVVRQTVFEETVFR